MTGSRDRYAAAARRIADRIDDDKTLMDSSTQHWVSQQLRQSAESSKKGTLKSPGNFVASLVRMIVDGNGPREPEHWLYTELTTLDDLHYQAICDSAPIELPRTVARVLSENPSEITSYLRLFGHAMTVVPTASSGAIPDIITPDGNRFLPCFTNPDLASEWAEKANQSMDWGISVLRLREVYDLASSAGLAGIVVNPGFESAFVQVRAIA